MNIGHQVCSIELAKKLKELHVEQESLFYWFDCKSHKYLFCKYYEQYSEHVDLDIKNGFSAFTVSELGEILFNPLPNLILNYKNNDDYVCAVGNRNNKLVEFREETEVNARAKMLIYLLENGYNCPKLNQKDANNDGSNQSSATL